MRRPRAAGSGASATAEITAAEAAPVAATGRGWRAMADDGDTGIGTWAQDEPKGFEADGRSGLQLLRVSRRPVHENDVVGSVREGRRALPAACVE